MRLKSASKEKQKDFLDHLKGLFENPHALIPQCVDGGLFCNFNSYRKKIDAVAQNEAYDKFSKSPDQFLSGLSETHRIMLSDSATLFGMLKTQFGSIEYAKRGNTDDTVMAGIQHYDDPLWRMLAFSSIAKTKGSRIYSSRNFFLASCRNSSPGTDFFKDVLSDEGIQFTEDNGIIIIPGNGRYMEITHLNSVTFRIYENSSANTMHALLKHLITPDIGKDFLFSSEFLYDLVREIPQNSLGMYLAGKINDRTFIREVNDFRTSAAIRQRHFIVGEKCYRNADEFLDNEQFRYVPRDIMKDSLDSLGKGIYMDAFSERKVLETVWPGSGKNILRSMFPELSDSDLNSMRGSPIDQIEGIHERTRIMDIKSGIEATSWSPDSQYLIDILKNFFTYGKERALREAEKGSGQSNVRKAIFYAFLECVGESRNKEWQFSDTDRDLSWKIKPYISRILESGPDVINEQMENIKVFIK